MKNEGIQLLRVFLFLGIVVFHFGLSGSALLWGGVETFFLLSAYFLTKKLLRKNSVCVLDELKKRIKRLYPMYIVIIIFTFVVVLVAKKRFAFDELIIHCAFLQNFYWMCYSKSSLFMTFSAHTWTLGIEIWLFLIWVICFKYIKNKQRRKIFNVVMIFLAIGYRTFAIKMNVDALAISLFPLGHADAFAIGSLLALDDNKVNNRRSSILFCTIGGILIISSVIVTSNINHIGIIDGYNLYKDSANYFNNIFTGNIYAYILLLSAGIVKSCFSIEQFRIPLFSQLAKAGNYTYGAYLVHWPIRTVLLHFVSGNILWAIFVAVISITCAYVFEKNIKSYFMI